MNSYNSKSGVSLTEWFQRFNIVVVVPAYNVEREVDCVLKSMPAYVRHIVVVDDASVDKTAEIVARAALDDRRIVPMQHASNQGVGGAMVTGFRRALELQAQIVVKIDGDGQMNTADMPGLLIPLVLGEADYCKGNRFHHFQDLRRMSVIRRFGNIALSFFTKAAVGYWRCFDPTNGFVAINGSVLAQIPLEKVYRCYFFETSMLSQLYLLGAVVRDVPIPARYGSETSNLSVGRVMHEFPRRLLACFCRRIILKNFVYDFTMESIYLLCGVPLLMTGVIYGGINWLRYAPRGIGAPTGTVVISAMLIILGFQIILAAVGLDLEAVPREPICKEPMLEEETVHGANTAHETVLKGF
jgi:dolichol-phosphate mannosyltransferase